LTWNDNLAAKAQQWANGCQFKHSGGTLGAFGGKVVCIDYEAIFWLTLSSYQKTLPLARVPAITSKLQSNLGPMKLVSTCMVAIFKSSNLIAFQPNTTQATLRLRILHKWYGKLQPRLDVLSNPAMEYLMLRSVYVYIFCCDSMTDLLL
jgi:hypothetical protein